MFFEWHIHENYMDDKMSTPFWDTSICVMDSESNVNQYVFRNQCFLESNMNLRDRFGMEFNHVFPVEKKPAVPLAFDISHPLLKWVSFLQIGRAVGDKRQRWSLSSGRSTYKTQPP